MTGVCANATARGRQTHEKTAEFEVAQSKSAATLARLAGIPSVGPEPSLLQALGATVDLLLHGSQLTVSRFLAYVPWTLCRDTRLHIVLLGCACKALSSQSVPCMLLYHWDCAETRVSCARSPATWPTSLLLHAYGLVLSVCLCLVICSDRFDRELKTLNHTMLLAGSMHRRP